MDVPQYERFVEVDTLAVNDSADDPPARIIGILHQRGHDSLLSQSGSFAPMPTRPEARSMIRQGPSPGVHVTINTAEVGPAGPDEVLLTLHPAAS